MYEKAGIAPLSQTQVSRLLNHHSVRVKPGNHHTIELSKEQMKKHRKAQMKGTGHTLMFDPFQVANMQHLRQEVGKRLKSRGGRLLIDEPFTARQAVNTIGDFAKDPKGTIGFGTGGKINRINKYNRWTGAIGDTIKSIGDYLAPVAKPILQAGTEKAVEYINNTPTFGGAVQKKKRGRPKKGGNIAPPGVSPGKGLNMHKKCYRQIWCSSYSNESCKKFGQSRF